jgi:hypothetical protein
MQIWKWAKCDDPLFLNLNCAEVAHGAEQAGKEIEAYGKSSWGRGGLEVEETQSEAGSLNI